MGFWSKLMGRQEDFVFSDAPPSQYLSAALQEAENRPIDDFTLRIVFASPKSSLIIDINLFQVEDAFTAYARGGIQKARLNAAAIIMDAIKSRPVDDAIMATALLAFFDTNFTVGANRGRTSETVTNTLALDAEFQNERLRVTRSAHRLSFPFAPISLDFEYVLNRFTGGKK